MALPETGPLSFAEINVELGKAANAPITLGDAVVRALAGKSSGAISFQDLRGMAGGITVTNIRKTGNDGYRIAVHNDPLSPNGIYYENAFLNRNPGIQIGYISSYSTSSAGMWLYDVKSNQMDFTGAVAAKIGYRAINVKLNGVDYLFRWGLQGYKRYDLVDSAKRALFNALKNLNSYQMSASVIY